MYTPDFRKAATDWTRKYPDGNALDADVSSETVVSSAHYQVLGMHGDPPVRCLHLLERVHRAQRTPLRCGSGREKAAHPVGPRGAL